MIPKDYTRLMLKGEKAIVERDIRNNAGAAVGKGSVVYIVDVVRGKGLTIKTEKCPHCGQYAYISGVSREELTLVTKREA